jgi:hypothetical protein
VATVYILREQKGEGKKLVFLQPKGKGSQFLEIGGN